MFNSEGAIAKQSRRRRWLGAAFLFCFLLAAFILLRKVGLAGENLSTSVRMIRAWATGFGTWGPLVFVLAGSTAYFVTVPAVLIIHFSVILFGYLTGGIVSTLSLLSGTSLIYLIGQSLGRPFVLDFLGNRLGFIEARFLHRELINVIYLRLLFFMNPLITWLLCVTGVRYHNILLGTLIGNAHNIILNVWFSGLIVDSIQAGRSVNPLERPIILVPLLIGLTIFLVVRIFDGIYKKRRKRNGAQ
jgi:uncharacterized membrane protein YdjX (TVP38/TMEM64 family)